MESFDFACELYYAANKYILIHLKEECLKYMLTELRPENACRGYEFAKLFDETDLMEECLQIIRTQTSQVLSAPSFGAVNICTIVTLLDQEELDVNSELDLFNVLEEYVKVNDIKSPVVPQQLIVDQTLPSPDKDITSSGTPDGNSSPACDENPVLETPQDDVSPPPKSPDSSPTIRDAVKRIRFLTMTANEFAEGPAKSDLLSHSEIFAFLMNISSSNCGTPLPEGFSRSTDVRKEGGGDDSYRFLCIVHNDVWQFSPQEFHKTMTKNITLIVLAMAVFECYAYDPEDPEISEIIPPAGQFEAFYPKVTLGSSSRAPHGHGTFYKYRHPALVDAKNSAAYGFRFDGGRRFNFD